MNDLPSLKTAFRVNLAFKMMQKFNRSKNLKKKKQWKKRYSLIYIIIKICQIKPYSVLF